MLKLTLEHIEQIRKYFLETEEEEKIILQKNITPNFLGGFLNDLRHLFIYTPTDEEGLVSVGNLMGAAEHIEVLKEIQQDYYSHLASVFIRGERNADIEILLKVNNPLFAKEVNYQSDIQKSFRLTGRGELKNKFQDIDTKDDIQTDEMFKVFRLIEREKLKKQFEALEVTRTAKTGSGMEAIDFSLSMPEATGEAAGRSIKRKFNWRRLAIAASIIGVIVIASVILVNKEKRQTDLAKRLNIDKSITDTNQLRHEDEMKDLLADNQLMYSESQMNVLEEQSLGFGQKVEEIKVRAYILNDKVSKLEKVISGKINGKEGREHARSVLMSRIDSLNSLIDTYTFEQGVLSIYLRLEAKLRIYRVTGKYFVKVNNVIYYINARNTFAAFKEVTDKLILTAIEKIDFKESN